MSTYSDRRDVAPRTSPRRSSADWRPSAGLGFESRTALAVRPAAGPGRYRVVRDPSHVAPTTADPDADVQAGPGNHGDRVPESHLPGRLGATAWSAPALPLSVLDRGATRPTPPTSDQDFPGRALGGLFVVLRRTPRSESKSVLPTSRSGQPRESAVWSLGEVISGTNTKQSVCRTLAG